MALAVSLVVGNKNKKLFTVGVGRTIQVLLINSSINPVVLFYE